MGCCYVKMHGKDGQKHSTTLDASSAFDAVDKATDSWSRYWWFDASAIVTVQCGEQRWNISQVHVRDWRAKRVGGRA